MLKLPTLLTTLNTPAVICLHVIRIFIGLHSLRRAQPHNITLKHGCGFSYSLDQGTTNDMPIHIEPLGQAAECEPMSADFHLGFSVIPKWRSGDLSIFSICWQFIARLLNK